MSHTIAVTTGEPAGIGPEICVKAVFTGRFKSPVTLVGDKRLLIETSEKLGFGSLFPDSVFFDDVRLSAPVVPGKPDTANAPYVVETLRRAAAGAQNGTYEAVVTAPVQKSIIDEAGIPFTGHTEFFQHAAGVDNVVMMLTSGCAADALRVALVTTHLPLPTPSRPKSSTPCCRSARMRSSRISASSRPASPSRASIPMPENRDIWAAKRSTSSRLPSTGRAAL